MRKTMWATLGGAAAVALLLALAHARAQDDPEAPRGGIATLYALDHLTHSFCFGDGRPGSVVQDGEVRNRCSDIDFGNLTADGFSVGIEGGRLGSIVDLGAPEDLSRRYGYAETVGRGQGFASLTTDGSRVRILKDRKAGTWQDLAESAALFGEGKGRANAPVRLGNIYLVRLTDRRDKSFQRLVKLQVIAHAPNQSVTIRWQRL